MSTQALNADLPSPDGFDGTHGVAPKMWFIVDRYTATSHKTLKEKEEGAQNAKYSKNHQKTLENAPYNYAIFERIS